MKIFLQSTNHTIWVLEAKFPVSQEHGNGNLAEKDMPEDFNIHSDTNGSITCNSSNDELVGPLFKAKNVHNVND